MSEMTIKTMQQRFVSAQQCSDPYNRFFKGKDFGEGVTVSYDQFHTEWQKVEKLCTSQPENFFRTDPVFLGGDTAIKKKHGDTEKSLQIASYAYLVKWIAYLVTVGVCVSQIYSKRQTLQLSNLKAIPRALWQNKPVILSLGTSALATVLHQCFERQFYDTRDHYSSTFYQAMEKKHKALLEDESLRLIDVGTCLSSEIKLGELGVTFPPAWTQKEGYTFARLQIDRNPLALIGEYKLDALLQKGLVSKLEVVACNVLSKAYHQRIVNFVQKHQDQAPQVIARPDSDHLVYSKEAYIVHKKTGEDVQTKKLQELAGFCLINDPIHRTLEQIIRQEQLVRMRDVRASIRFTRISKSVCFYAHTFFGRIYFQR